ncbi:MAG: cyclodeaminase/cyclohydrolase family protein [Clostridiales bacterium]|nr:cyclodeaminase/cyclohydrolase family protein [Clostridiales bacterium]
MALCDMTVKSYLDLLSSSEPAPGGGSASALCGAQGAALVEMVARLTVGKKKYACYAELCENVIKKAAALKAALLSQADKDAQAFNLVAAAYKLPKDTEEECAARKAAISKATLISTEVPFETMKLCTETLLCAKELVGKSNVNAASDLAVAALNLVTGAVGAYSNVLINLGGIDEGKAEVFRADGEEMTASAKADAEYIFKAAVGSL